MPINCEFCNKPFKTEYTLKTHQKTAKYCILKQKSDNIIMNEFTCEYCNKIFSTKNRLLSHIEICKVLKNERDAEYLKNKIELKICKEQLIFFQQKEIEYKEQIRELQDKMERITTTAISRPTTVQTNTNTINNKYSYLSPLTLTSDEIKNRVETHFTHEHFKKGQLGVADFACKYIIPDEDGKPTYIFADIARKKCVFKDADGEIIPDIKCQKLINMIIAPINVRAKRIYDELYASVEDSGSDDDVFRKRMVFLSLLQEIARLPRDSIRFGERILQASNTPLPPSSMIENGDQPVVFVIESDSEDETPPRVIPPDELPFIDFDDPNIDRLVGLKLDRLKIIYKNGHIEFVNMEPCIYFYKDENSKLRLLYCQYQGEDDNKIYMWYTYEGRDFVGFPDPGIKITENVYAIRYLEDKRRVRIRYRDGREVIREMPI